jgi:hypothetical protein
MIGSTQDELEYWRAEARKLATLLMSSYVWVHEYKSSEVDAALKPYLGKEARRVLQESREGVRWDGPA